MNKTKEKKINFLSEAELIKVMGGTSEISLQKNNDEILSGNNIVWANCRQICLPD